jgi:addiction module HigA family antidote
MAKRIVIKIGDILRDEYLKPLKISQYRLAKEIGVSNTLISKIIRGETSLTPDTAYKLSLFFNTTVDYWLNMQVLCDLDEIKDKYEKKPIIIASYKNFIKNTQKKLA